MSSLHAVPSPGRRAVTLALTGVLALLTAGCGVRLQEDAPDLPLVPRRPKMPGEEVLLGLLGDTVGLVAATSAASGEVEKALADLHVAQERVLRDALRRGGVPSAVIGAGASPGPTNPATLVAMEAAASHDRGRYAALSPELGRVVLTLLAQLGGAGIDDHHALRQGFELAAEAAVGLACGLDHAPRRTTPPVKPRS